jgi:hypothetical protein
MKLLSRLRYSSDSAAGAPVGSGNHGGCLRLFFATLNAEDIQQHNPFFWEAGISRRAAGLPLCRTFLEPFRLLRQPALLTARRLARDGPSLPHGMQP